ncbi:SagB family peptide dehydrogenase [Kitasatospora sp. NPDC048540]|uniref:SagB family peptide dehydrogenase n=1 Tax=unclassified Kitasatospora TaxID=2633591 RepID=UPI00068A8492|nr:SagB family peptide dehydrogenase [Kitasatospora sp. MBT63]
MDLPARGSAPELQRLWSLREDVDVEFEGPRGDAVLRNRWTTVRLARPDRAGREALRRMTFGPISLGNILRDAESGAPARLSALLGRIQHLTIRSVGLTDSELPLLSVVPISPAAVLEPVELRPDQPIRLSRFAVLSGSGAGLTVESPLSLFRVAAHRPAVAGLLGALGWTTTLAELTAAQPFPSDAVREMAGHLLGAGLAVAGTPGRGGGPAEFTEDSDPVLSLWSPVDLLFHTRSTIGRHDHDFGATFAHAGRVAPEPAVRPAPEGPRFTLPRPAADGPATPPLGAVLERSAPEPDCADPVATLSLEQLGELLYRSARVRSVGKDPSGPPDYEVSDRPYSSFGGTHPLELYVTVNRCRGLPPGVFHYDPDGHRLTLVSDDREVLAKVLSCTRVSAGLAGAPPLVITLTARFARTAWKFSGQSYALVLRETGAALQTLELTAAAMGLATASLAAADISAGARVARLDWRAESSTGQLVVAPAAALPAAANHPWNYGA